MGYWKDWPSYYACKFCGGQTLFSWVEGSKITFVCLNSECLGSLDGKTSIPDYIKEAFKEEDDSHIK